MIECYTAAPNFIDLIGNISKYKYMKSTQVLI